MRKLERPIILGNFIFCPLQEMPLLGNDCQACEFVRKEEDRYFCLFEAKEDSSDGSYPIKTIIDVLLDRLLAGQKDLCLDELETLLKGSQ